MEAIRSIQKLRKESGLKPSDIAELEYYSSLDAVKKIIENNSEAIKSSMGAKSIVISGDDYQTKLVSVEMSTGKINIAIK